MEIVFLETISLGDDINLDRFDELGHVTKYRDTPVELVPERVKDADVVVINKIPMNEKTLAGASHLELGAGLSVREWIILPGHIQTATASCQRM